MAWIMHSSGPWKDHKYKERTGTPGNYTYKYGTESDGSGNTVETVNTTHGPSQRVTRSDKETTLGYIEEHKAAMNNKWNKNSPGGRNYQLADIRNTYYADRTGYQRSNNARHDLVGDDNEAKKKHVRYNDRRKQFESQTLSAMRNALNQAKENKNRKTDGDMRDAAVARGREQYMTNRVAKTINNIQNDVRKKKEEEKRAAYRREMARRAAYGR